MSFYAYNPLAAGMLSGKYKSLNDIENGSRFKGDSPWVKIYQSRFMQENQFKAIDIIKQACQKANIPMAEASLRWLTNHSQLNSNLNDGLIVGASSMQHYNDNMASLTANTPLPDALVKAFDVGYELCKNNCPSYSRGYSGSQSGQYLQKTNILMAEASSRWLTHHSQLNSTLNDGLIVGASM
eukprot:Pgem_evm2s7871